jgi:hypothetical protein
MKSIRGYLDLKKSIDSVEEMEHSSEHNLTKAQFKSKKEELQKDLEYYINNL